MTVNVTNVPKDVTVDPTSLVFTPSQLENRNQTVTVTVDEDAGGTDEENVTLDPSAKVVRLPAGVDVPDVTVTIPVEGVPSHRGGCRRPPAISASH